MITTDKIIEIFCIADDFYKEYELEIQKRTALTTNELKTRNRASQLSQSEIMTILVGFHYGTFRNFKHYYLFYIKQHLKSEFPNAVSYNRFIELQARVLIPLMLFLQLIGFGQCTGITYVDSTKISVCHNKRISRNKVFKDVAERGKSTMGWFFGFKLHLVCNEKGELLNFSLTKGNVDDRNQDVLNVLTKDLFGKLFADKGYISKPLFETLFNDGIHLVTGIRNNMKNCLMPLRDKILLRKRSVIETINDELKNICHIEHSRHRATHNFIMNLVAGLVAYCFFPKKPSINIEWEKSPQLSLNF
jgi:hypothetical protein